MITLSGITTNTTRRYRVLLPPFMLIAVFLFGGMPYVQADDSQTHSAQANNDPPISVLDGKTFVGELGLVGKSGIADLFVFRDGMFVSEECERRCGYPAGPYWVRSEGDGVQFRSEIPCVKSDAIMAWIGTVKGDKIEGTVAWTSKRWYWTIEKEFWFKGKLVDSNLATTE